MEGQQFTLRQPPNDPNRTRNRIPSQQELVTLRNIRSNKRQLANHTKQELDVAKEAHERIQARYDNLINEIEAIQSELNISHDYLITLEKQLKTFREEDDRLAGLLHPIRRCPEEVLMLIFECFSEFEEDEKFKIATTISHVCRTWRSTALKTSSLWTEMTISMNSDIKAIKSFGERSRSRLRSTPPRIYIQHVRARPLKETEKIMEGIGLKQFPNIALLVYGLDISKDVDQLAQAAFGCSPTYVKHLVIRSESVSEQVPLWQCDYLLNRFTGLHTLQLDNLGVAILGGNDSYPSLREIYFDDIYSPTLASQLPRFLGLEEFQLNGTQYDMQPLQQDLTLPNLKELEIVDVHNFPWSQINAPLLRSLKSNDLDDKCCAFIRRHPTIRILHHYVWETEPCFKDIARLLGDLEVLGTGGSIGALFRQTDAETPFPSFPKLEELTIDTRSGHGISLQDFEDLTKLRCLSQNTDSAKERVKKLDICTILVPTSEIDSVAWRKSPLMAHWKETTTKVPQDEHLYTVELKPLD